MKKAKHMKTSHLQNPYENTIEEAKRKIEKIDDLEFLNDIPDDDENRHPSIPFPYGDKSIRPYNFS